MNEIDAILGAIFKKKIKKRVYYLYLSGVDIIVIAIYLKLTIDEVNEIIDYMNLIYV